MINQFEKKERYKNYNDFSKKKSTKKKQKLQGHHRDETDANKNRDERGIILNISK